MGCIHIHFRRGVPTKVTYHDFRLDEEVKDGVFHIEDNKSLHYFPAKTFNVNHSVDRHEISDIPCDLCFDMLEEGYVRGITLCPKCEKSVPHKINLSGLTFIGLQTLNVLKECPICKLRWVAEIKFLAGRVPIFYNIDGTLVPDETTLRQKILDSGLPED